MGLNEVAGLYSGLDQFEAPKKLWAELEETGLAEKKEPHTLRVPRSQRGGEIYNHWLSNIKEWCISKQLWWGHWIPVWYIVGKDNEECRSTEEKNSSTIYYNYIHIYIHREGALWPFSTLGWPDLSAEDFQRFYPTTMLETGYVPGLFASAPW
ncbi:hypothetical protein QN277_003669 [Acacia crassicarpa]|uniref:valine--tRNA ligase n=1 Tax=Acacia crassicarpa TaxID=499986 RepID=A0AAE1MFS9_9FABA|nr:hypothetical protein QN277_003669 [Acacia crassicarpa]